MSRRKEDLTKYQAEPFDVNGYVSEALPEHLAKASCSFELSRQLRSRDDIMDLMQTYSNTIQRLAPHDYLRFEHKAMNIDIEIGHGGIHKCTYNLYFSHYSLGRITLSRNERFSDNELSSLENTLCILFYPLDEMIHHDSQTT